MAGGWTYLGYPLLAGDNDHNLLLAVALPPQAPDPYQWVRARMTQGLEAVCSVYVSILSNKCETYNMKGFKFRDSLTCENLNLQSRRPQDM